MLAATGAQAINNPFLPPPKPKPVAPPPIPQGPMVNHKAPPPGKLVGTVNGVEIYLSKDGSRYLTYEPPKEDDAGFGGMPGMGMPQGSHFGGGSQDSPLGGGRKGGMFGGPAGGATKGAKK